MVSFSVDLVHIRGVDIDLKAGEHEKARLVHVGMIDNGVVVGQAQNLVAKSFVGFFHFLPGQLSIGDGTVGVQVCLKVLSYLR